MLATIFKLVWDDVVMIFTQVYLLFYKCWNLKDKDDDIEAQLSLLQKQLLKEFIFVIFNAWVFNKTDELWVVLIRELYRVVELRLSKMPPNKSSMCSSQWNYKFKWRVERAKDLLIESYGGEDKLRFQLYFPILVVLLGLLLALVLKTVGAVQLLNDILTKLGLMWKIILASLGAIPSLKLLYDANKNAGTSRGDALFTEASGSIKDKVGFMEKVSKELTELFAFLKRYKEETDVDLRIVLFVDDLDRCVTNGRNVMVLEAIQLLLNILYW